MTQESLPTTLPIFPLTGTVLLPGMMLPLHIFEPRYSNMLTDVVESHKMIGMIQPLVPRQDNQAPISNETDMPELYPVGCVGLVESHKPLKDGRFKIVLRGISRFRIAEELPLHPGGYRQVVPDYAEYMDDQEEVEEELDGTLLLRAFVEFAMANGHSPDMAVMEGLPGPLLTNGIAMMLPFGSPEKQALLEAEDVAARMETLFSLFQMGTLPSRNDRFSPPEIN